MKHYSKEEIDAYLNKQTSFLKSLFCRIHLLKCKSCREIYQECQQDSIFIRNVKQAAQELDQPENEQERQKLTAIFEQERKV